VKQSVLTTSQTWHTIDFSNNQEEDVAKAELNKEAGEILGELKKHCTDDVPGAIDEAYREAEGRKAKKSEIIDGVIENAFNQSSSDVIRRFHALDDAQKKLVNSELKKFVKGMV
jgi:hypothetical protein